MLSHRGDALSRPDPNFRFFQIISQPWHPETSPSGYVNLGVAENTLVHNRLIAKIKSEFDMTSSALTYGDGQKRLKRAAARFITRNFNAQSPLTADHVAVTNGCTTAIQNLSWALANPGDVFLIGRPFYGGMPTDVERRTGVTLRPVSFGAVDPTSVAAVQIYEEELLHLQEQGKRVAGLIIVNPHNPLGRCYSRAALEAFMRLCQRHSAHLVCNEIYGLSVYKAPKFTSILSIDHSGLVDADKVHMLWGMSKDFGANGLRVGFTVSRNAQLHAALQAVFEFSWSSSVSDDITARIFEDEAFTDAYLADNRRQLATRHAHVTKWAEKQNIPCLESNAGFFVWVNLGAVWKRLEEDIDKAVMHGLLAQRVFLADGVRFGAEEMGWFRIIFAHEEGYLAEGLNRIEAAIEASNLH